MGRTQERIKFENLRERPFHYSKPSKQKMSLRQYKVDRESIERKGKLLFPRTYIIGKISPTTPFFNKFAFFKNSFLGIKPQLFSSTLHRLAIWSHRLSRINAGHRNFWKNVIGIKLHRFSRNTFSQEWFSHPNPISILVSRKLIFAAIRPRRSPLNFPVNFYSGKFAEDWISDCVRSMGRHHECVYGCRIAIPKIHSRFLDISQRIELYWNIELRSSSPKFISRSPVDNHKRIEC